jgi:hypothetical protein
MLSGAQWHHYDTYNQACLSFGVVVGCCCWLLLLVWFWFVSAGLGSGLGYIGPISISISNQKA